MKEITNTTIMTRGDFEEMLRGMYDKDTRIKVHSTDDGLIISKAGLTVKEKTALANRILWNAMNPTHHECDFYRNGGVTICIMNYNHRTRVGSAVCAHNDIYGRSIGEAIAYERAKYGKVKTTDLL